MIGRISLHIAFWLTYLSLKLYMAVFLMNYSYFEMEWGDRILKSLLPELLVLPPKLLMAYTIMYFIIPKFNQIVWWKLLSYTGLLLIACLLLYHVLQVYVVYPVVHKEAGPAFQLTTEGISRFIWRLLDMLTVVGVACTFKLMRKQARDAKKEQQLVKEKLQSELNFLRAQTNPHFLFNTLNSIYALSRRQSPQTPDVVMQLSKLLRYMLHECREPFVPLEREWKVIEDYVALEKLRYGNRVDVSMKKENVNGSFLVAPLLFLPLVENAFKHGAGNNRHHTKISIDMKQHNGSLDFMVKNNFEITDEDPDYSFGIGLQNVKRQLELLYPGHEMKIQNGENSFMVSIHLKTHAALPDR